MGRMSFDPDMEESGRIINDLMAFDERDNTSVDGWSYNYQKAAAYVQQERLRAKIEAGNEMFALILPETQYPDPGAGDSMRVSAEAAHQAKNRYIADLTKQLKEYGNGNE